MIGILLARLPIAARGITLLSNAVMALVVGRLFGATASGEFFLAFAAINLAGMVGRLGTENFAIKVLPGLYHSKNHQQFWAELTWLRRVCHRGGVGAAAVLFLFGLGVTVFGFAENLGTNLMILAVSVPFTSSAILNSSALRSANRISIGAFAETGLSQGLTILSLLIITSNFEVSALAIAISYSASSVVTAVLASVWTRRAVSRNGVANALHKTRAEAVSMLSMMGSSVLFFLLTAGPLFALGIAGTARDVGLFNAAARSSTFIALIPALQTTYLIPRVARALGEGDIAGVNDQLRRAVRLAGLFGVLLAIGMLAFSEPIMRAFGDDFQGARPILFVLVIGQTFILLIGNVNPLMAVCGLERYSLLTALGVVGLGTPLMVIGAFFWGGLAVATVFILSTLTYSVISAALLKTRAGIQCFLN